MKRQKSNKKQENKNLWKIDGLKELLYTFTNMWKIDKINSIYVFSANIQNWNPFCDSVSVNLFFNSPRYHK